MRYLKVGSSGWLVAGGLEVLLGITGKDFTLIGASKAAMRGATILKASDDKTRALNKHTLLAFSGEAGDTVQFAEYIQRNAQLYSMRNETELSPSGLAHFVRGELATSLRSRNPYNVNLLMGGVDPITGKPSLYWLDYLASLAEVPYAAHGYAQYYCLSLLDKHHHPDITLGQGIKLMTMCIDELKRRLPIDFKGMVVKAIKADGIVDIEFDDDRIVKTFGDTGKAAERGVEASREVKTSAKVTMLRNFRLRRFAMNRLIRILYLKT
ncbi:hypothetical protein MKX07_000697 [Trichoderma sp. CBMAI-0711]|nr:hypothetical protein MKX07_000697 [Trichoderma sp. CBMAI-0711]